MDNEETVKKASPAEIIDILTKGNERFISGKSIHPNSDSHRLALANEKNGIHLSDPHERMKENLFVYRIGDLNALEDEMDQFWEASLYFNAYLREKSGKTKSNHRERINNFQIIKNERKNQL